MKSIRIIYFPECANFRKSCDIICEIIQESKLNVKITLEPLDSHNSSYFKGSPTILINNIDIEDCYYGKESNKDSNPDEMVHSCRLFQCNESPLCPSLEALQCALLN